MLASVADRRGWGVGPAHPWMMRTERVASTARAEALALPE